MSRMWFMTNGRFSTFARTSSNSLNIRSSFISIINWLPRLCNVSHIFHSFPSTSLARNVLNRRREIKSNRVASQLFFGINARHLTRNWNWRKMSGIFTLAQLICCWRNDYAMDASVLCVEFSVTISQWLNSKIDDGIIWKFFSSMQMSRNARCVRQISVFSDFSSQSIVNFTRILLSRKWSLESSKKFIFPFYDFFPFIFTSKHFPRVLMPVNNWLCSNSQRVINSS